MRKTIVEKLLLNHPSWAIRLDQLSPQEDQILEAIKKADTLVGDSSSPNLSERTWAEYDACLMNIRSGLSGYSGKYEMHFKTQLANLEDRQRVVLGYG